MATLIQRLLRRRGYDLVPYPTPVPSDFDEETAATCKAVYYETMTSKERIGALVNAVRWVTDRKVPGAIVECGVWRGGSMMSVARTLLERDVTDRDLYLFDTFDGMSAPTEHDRKGSGQSAEDAMREQLGPDAQMSDWCAAAIDIVRHNMSTTGYPEDRIHYVKGMVEDTLPENAPETIALLRLDTDFYESTRHELEHLFHRVSPGGIVLFDDYGYWEGSRRAIDDFLADRPDLFLHRIDRPGRLLVLPG